MAAPKASAAQGFAGAAAFFGAGFFDAGFLAFAGPGGLAGFASLAGLARFAALFVFAALAGCATRFAFFFFGLANLISSVSLNHTILHASSNVRRGSRAITFEGSPLPSVHRKLDFQRPSGKNASSTFWLIQTGELDSAARRGRGRGLRMN